MFSSLEGVLICSTGGIDGGYWLAQDVQEYLAYRGAELVARLDDLQQQLQAMDAGAQKQFGPGSLQMEMGL